jgi:hypothetical protein
MTFNAIRMTLGDIQNSINFCRSKIEQMKEIETPISYEETESYNQIIDYLKEYKHYLEFEKDWK